MLAENQAEETFGWSDDETFEDENFGNDLEDDLQSYETDLRSEATTDTARLRQKSFVKASKRGWLTKQGGGQSALGRKSWKERWFVLENDKLSYHASVTSKPLGVIHLQDVTACECSNTVQNTTQFALVTEQRIYRLDASTPEDCERWLLCLRKAITQCHSAFGQGNQTACLF
eukprot:m.31731 g.31731  ORF g.31731 m.31731 type:complete len:173 (-) comp14829_c0_seq1:206-724(-)